MVQDYHAIDFKEMEGKKRQTPKLHPKHWALKKKCYFIQSV